MILRPISKAALAATLLILSGCDAASTLVGRDPYVDPSAIQKPALQAGATAAAVQAFYEARDWRPAWSAASAAQLTAAFEGALVHGLDPARFEAMVTSQDPTEREVQLTAAALAYAGALDHGLVDPKALFGIYAMDVHRTDVAAGLSDALDRKRLNRWLNTLAPQDAEYAALSEAYLRYRDLAGRPQPPVIGEGDPLKPGVSDPRTPQLEARLAALGYLNPAADEGADPELYTEATAEAVKAFQNDQGIQADGEVGPDTLAVLNAGADDRARQLAINLEVRRWLPRNPAADRIDVNLPGAFLIWYRDGRAHQSRRVVVGSPANPTPHLASAFSQVVVNPPWNVPAGIAQEEILPKGAAYMAARNMTMIDGRVVQRPGPNAALGLVKFDMQNPHAIYLHDTPSKTFFAQNERYLSHGCVRVDGAVDFARQIAAAYGEAGIFNARLESGDTSVVELRTEIPVRLLYHTVFIADGQVAFRPDVYGYDERVARAMNLPPPVKRTVAETSADDIGP